MFSIQNPSAPSLGLWSKLYAKGMIHNCQHQNTHILCLRVASMETMSSRPRTRHSLQHIGCKLDTRPGQLLGVPVPTRPRAHRTGSFPRKSGELGSRAEAPGAACPLPAPCLPRYQHPPTSITHSGEIKEKSWRRLKEQKTRWTGKEAEGKVLEEK